MNALITLVLLGFVVYILWFFVMTLMAEVDVRREDDHW